MKLMGLTPRDPLSEERETVQPIHECQDHGSTDEVDALILGNNWFDRVKRQWLRKIILSKNHPVTKTCIKSNAAINREINRHIRNHPCMIHPFSEFRNSWIKLMTIFTFCSLFLVPFVLAFHLDELENWTIIFTIINIGFFLDTFMWFFTGYFNPKTRIINLDREFVIRKYLKTFFPLDLLSGFPLELFYTFSYKNYGTMWCYWTAFDLLKIFRLRNLVIYFRKLSEIHQLSFQLHKIIEMLITVIICIHWATCLEFYVSSVGMKMNWRDSNRLSWLASKYMRLRNSTFRRYVASANRAAIALVGSSHFLDVKSPEDILLNLCLSIIGRIGYIYVLAQFLQLMTTFHTTRKRNVKLLQQLQEYMQYKELPHHIQQRILTYYKYWCRKSYDRNQLIIENVSPNLRQDLLMHDYSNLIKTVKFFKYLPSDILTQVVMQIKTEVYLKDDIIMEQGTIGDALYYISSGTVLVKMKKEEEVCQLEDGSYFGEVSLVMENEKCLATVQAMETCEVCVLKQSDFIRTITSHPNLLSRLQKLAIESLDKTLLRQTRNKQEQATFTTINIGGRSKDQRID